MADEIKIETATHKLFTKKAIAVLNGYAFLCFVPLSFALLPIVVIAMLGPASSAFVLSMLFLSLALLVMALILPIYFLPIILGNPHIRKLVRSLHPSNQNGFIIQLKKLPPAKSGFWALMEDADDVGLLSLNEETLVFKGDSTNFSIPFASIKSVRRRNVGWRGAWIYGNRIVIDISEQSFEFAERFSLSIPASRKISEELFDRLSTKIKK